MHLPIFKFVAIVIGSALCAVLGLFRDALRTGKDPSDEGPRALIAEFLGLWVCLFFFIWSFTVERKALQWELRGIAVFAAILGVGLWYYFANTTEVPEAPDEEPTGFKSDITSIHLE